MNEIEPMFAEVSLQAASPNPKPGSPDELRKACQDFEAVLVHMMLKTMDKTIESSGLVNDSAVKQARGMLWMTLSQEIARAGGLGLWKSLERSLAEVPAASQDDRKVPKP